MADYFKELADMVVGCGTGKSKIYGADQQAEHSSQEPML